MRIIFIRYLDLTELDALPEADIEPSVTHQVQVIIGPRSDTVLPLLDLIRYEESQVELLLVFEPSLLLALTHSLSLMQSEELTVKDLAVVVHDDPEGFTLPVPSVVPSEVWSDCQLDFENGTGDREDVDFHFQTGNVCEELLQLINAYWTQGTSHIFNLPIIETIHSEICCFNAECHLVREVAELSDVLVLISELSNRGIDSHLFQWMIIWSETLIKDLAPSESDLSKI